MSAVRCRTVSLSKARRVVLRNILGGLAAVGGLVVMVLACGAGFIGVDIGEMAVLYVGGAGLIIGGLLLRGDISVGDV